MPNFTSLAQNLQVSVHTIKHWLQILENLYVIFPVRPYHQNIARSILKESKYYFYDTGAVDGGVGSRLENVVACALLRELHFIEDTTGSWVALHFIRDKEKREVDFLILIDKMPRLLLEVKTGDDNFSPHLFRFHQILDSAKPLQIVYNLRQNKSKGRIQMLAVKDFLRNLSF